MRNSGIQLKDFTIPENKLNIEAINSIKDISINVQSSNYVINSGDQSSLIDASGNITITFPDNLNNGFQVVIINAGIGTITLDASILLTTDSSVKLIDQYAGATAVHKGAGTWYAFGNLKN